MDCHAFMKLLSTKVVIGMSLELIFISVTDRIGMCVNEQI